jgi:hypothetical protein
LEKRGAEMYEYEVILPGGREHPRDMTPTYGREKTLGPVHVGQRLMFADVALGALTLPERMSRAPWIFGGGLGVNRYTAATIAASLVGVRAASTS